MVDVVHEMSPRSGDRLLKCESFVFYQTFWVNDFNIKSRFDRDRGLGIIGPPKAIRSFFDFLTATKRFGLFNKRSETTKKWTVSLFILVIPSPCPLRNPRVSIRYPRNASSINNDCVTTWPRQITAGLGSLNGWTSLRLLTLIYDS